MDADGISQETLHEPGRALQVNAGMITAALTICEALAARRTQETADPS